jgi:hypothetical protein
LTSALDRVSGQRHAPAVLTPRERTSDTHWIGVWVGPRAGLDTEATGRNPLSVSGIEPLTTDWKTAVRYPTVAKDSSCSLCIQTSSETHRAFYTMGTGGHFPGIKGGQGVTLTTHPHLVLMKRMSRSYASFPPWGLHGKYLNNFTFTYIGLYFHIVTNTNSTE